MGSDPKAIFGEGEIGSGKPLEDCGMLAGRDLVKTPFGVEMNLATICKQKWIFYDQKYGH